MKLSTIFKFSWAAQFVCMVTTVPLSACQDKTQGKNIVVVGSWNVDEHIDWAKRNVARSYQLRDDGAQKVK